MVSLLQNNLIARIIIEVNSRQFTSANNWLAMYHFLHNNGMDYPVRCQGLAEHAPTGQDRKVLLAHYPFHRSTAAVVNRDSWLQRIITDASFALAFLREA